MSAQIPGAAVVGMGYWGANLGPRPQRADRRRPTVDHDRDTSIVTGGTAWMTSAVAGSAILVHLCTVSGLVLSALLRASIVHQFSSPGYAGST
jgi:hypothetical protein